MEEKEEAAKLNLMLCHGLNMKCHPGALVFKHLVPNWCSCIGSMWNLLNVGHHWQI